MFVEHADSPAQVAKAEPVTSTEVSGEQATVVAITEQVLALPPPPESVLELLRELYEAEMRMTARMAQRRAQRRAERMAEEMREIMEVRPLPLPPMPPAMRAAELLLLQDELRGFFVNCVPGRHQLLTPIERF